MTDENLIQFDEVAQFLRNFIGYPEKKVISKLTRLEDDLGITGDDGDELFLRAEDHFGIKFNNLKQIFNLSKNEYLFHSEGFDIIELILSFLGHKNYSVRNLTAGEFYNAILKLKNIH
jgi:hypothetical protein